jgi:hypothetical protein
VAAANVASAAAALAAAAARLEAGRRRLTPRIAAMPMDSSMTLGSRLAPCSSRGTNRAAIATRPTATNAMTTNSVSTKPLSSAVVKDPTSRGC